MKSQLTVFKMAGSIVILIFGLVETVAFFDLQNIFATVVLIFGWFLIAKISLTAYNQKYHPVSFIMMLGLALFYYLLPLPLTLLELKPVTFNLKVPYLTFIHHFFFVVVIVLTHKVYSAIANGRNIFRSLLQKTDFYVEPTDKVIWFSAILGLFASFLNYFVMGAWQIENQDKGLSNLIASYLAQYIWMPLILLFKFRTNQQPPKGIRIIYITAYSAFVLVIAIASNWRTMVFSGVFLPIGLFGVGILFNYYELRKLFSSKMVILTLSAFVFLSGPFIDLASAMVAVRAERTSLSAFEFLNRTIEEYSNQDSIELVKESVIVGDDDKYNAYEYWNEAYLSNIVLNRLVNLKISDNCLYYAYQIGYESVEMQHEMFRLFIASMPSFIISALGEDPVNIKADTGYSIGDYLYSIALGASKVIASARISSISGVGMATFGYWYLILLMPIFLVIFTMFDSFVKIGNKKTIYSYMFFLQFLTAFNYFNDRHVFIFEFRYISRTYFEAVVLFLIFFKVIRFFSGLNSMPKKYSKEIV